MNVLARTLVPTLVAATALGVAAPVHAATDAKPVGKADAYTVPHGQELIVDVSSGLLANDSDPDGDPLTARQVSTTSHGTLETVDDGRFAYIPRFGYAGTDSFTYRPFDGEREGNLVTVRLTVLPDLKPTGRADSYTVAHGQELIVDGPGVLGNDTDPDGDALTARQVGNPAHGTLEMAEDGRFAYIPRFGYAGTDSFTYRPFDGEREGSPVTVRITVSDLKPIGSTDSYTVPHGQELIVDGAGVLENDTDPDGDSLTAKQVSNPAHGTLETVDDGRFAYIPRDDFAGTDSFTYRPFDGVREGNLVTVRITIE